MKIICVYDNYGRHQCNKAGDSAFSIQRPVVSVRPDSSLLKDGKPFFVPDFSDDIRCGSSIVLRVCRLGKCISTRFAHRYYDAVTVGVAFQARDLVDAARANGQPFSLYEGFDGASVLGDFVETDALLSPVGDVGFSLERNGVRVQEGNAADLVTGFDELIASISNYYTLKIGDLIYTGFPSQDLTVAIGDRMTGFIGTEKVLEFNIR